MNDLKRYVLSVCVGEDGDIEPELSERKDGFIVLYADHQSQLAEARKPKVCRWNKSTGRREGCGFYRMVSSTLGNYCKHCGGKVEVSDE